MRQSPAEVLNAMSTLRDEQHSRFPRHLFVSLLMVIFFVMLLLALMAGVSIYHRVADIQISTSEDRLGQQLVANYVRSTDSVNAVKVGTGPEGQSLVLLEQLESGNYETRIYLYEGAIVEEYAVEGSPYTYSKAVKLVDSSRFSFGYEDGLLTIMTDQGSTCVALRTTQGDS